MASNTSYMHSSFNARLIEVICLRVFCLYCGCREWICNMATLAGNFLCLAAVTVTSYAVWILHQCSSGVMMTIRAFFGQLNMLCVVELERRVQLALIVQGNIIGNRYPQTHARYCCQQQNNHYSGEPE